MVHFEPNRLTTMSPKNSKIKKILSEGLTVKINIHTTNLSSNEACVLEKKLILEYGRVDIGTGTLLNRTDGGENGGNRIVSKETIEKIKQTKSLRTYTCYDKSKKTASLISPEGILYKFTGVEEFRKTHNLGDAIRDVINGKTRSYKEWTSPDFKDYWKSKERSYVTVLSPTGELLTFNKTSEFCKKYNLNTSHLAQVINGKRQHHKGFKLA